MHYTRNWRSFSLSPAAGERAGERGPPVSSIPRSHQYVEPYSYTARPCCPMDLGTKGLCVQANGLFHTSPGQRPGFIARFVAAGQRPASSPMRMSRAFSAPDGFWGHEPRALPWAGMSDAFGVSIGRLWFVKCAHKIGSF